MVKRPKYPCPQNRLSTKLKDARGGGGNIVFYLARLIVPAKRLERPHRLFVNAKMRRGNIVFWRAVNTDLPRLSPADSVVDADVNGSA